MDLSDKLYCIALVGVVCVVEGGGGGRDAWYTCLIWALSSHDIRSVTNGNSYISFCELYYWERASRDGWEGESICTYINK